MAIAFGLAVECKIYCPAGMMRLSVSSQGLVEVMTSWPREDTRLSLDTIKAARERVRAGKCPKGFFMTSDPAPQPRAFWRLVLTAAEDSVKRFQGDLAEFAPPGTRFGKRNAYVFRGK